jgi:hypothetical protein
MCPSEYMPDLSDPAALSLVLCLLEVDGEKFGELADLAMDEIPYILGDMDKRSSFHADEPPFKASWVAIACEVDAVFSPALINFPSGSYKEVPPAPPGSGSLNIGVGFKHFNGTEFFFGGGEEVDAPEMIEGAERRLTSQSLALAAQEAKSKSRDEWGDAEGKEGGMPAFENGDGDFGGAMDESGRLSADGGMGYGGSYDEDSSEMVDAGFAAPERSQDIAYPKIFSKASLPDDTVGAIYSSNARDAKKQERFPTRLASESIATNDHMNLSSTVSRK